MIVNTRHLAEARMSYGAHLWFIWKVCVVLLVASMIAFNHGLLPWIFPRTVSGLVEDLDLVLKGKEGE